VRARPWIAAAALAAAAASGGLFALSRWTDATLARLGAEVERAPIEPHVVVCSFGPPQPTLDVLPRVSNGTPETLGAFSDEVRLGSRALKCATDDLVFERRFDDAHLAALDAVVARTTLPSLREAFERAYRGSAATAVRAALEGRTPAASRLPRALRRVALAHAWSRIRRAVREIEAAADDPDRVEAAAVLRAAVGSIATSWNPLVTELSPLLVGPSPDIFRVEDDFVARAALLRAAIALERVRLATGRYPESLGAIRRTSDAIRWAARRCDTRATPPRVERSSGLADPTGATKRARATTSSSSSGRSDGASAAPRARPACGRPTRLRRPRGWRWALRRDARGARARARRRVRPPPPP
jgi:YD repeat-containing protein